MRLVEFDILKGILIIFVIIGHIGITLTGFDVYWFHMPCFFMISGFFLKSNPDIPFIKKLKVNIKKYAIPYLSFNTIFYLMLIPEPFLKFMMRTFYGGLMNITIFSYPFWFINTLFVSQMILALLGKLKPLIASGIILIMYFIGYLYFGNMNLALPWGLECCLFAVPYMSIGYLFKSYQYKKWHWLIACIPLLVVLCSLMDYYQYKLDIASRTVEHPLIDLLIPFSFFWLLWRISIVLSKIAVIRTIFSSLGRSSMVIFFLMPSS